MTQAKMATDRKSSGDVCTVGHTTVYPTRDVGVAEDKSCMNIRADGRLERRMSWLVGARIHLFASSDIASLRTPLRKHP